MAVLLMPLLALALAFEMKADNYAAFSLHTIQYLFYSNGMNICIVVLIPG